MRTIDQTMAPPVGLPGRTWYRNLIYAPGRFTGYGAKTLPGVREASRKNTGATQTNMRASPRACSTPIGRG